MSNTNDPSKKSQPTANAEIPPGPVPAPAPRQAEGIPDPPLSTAVSDGVGDARAATPYQVVTDRIVALLEAGVVPWKASWIRQGYQPKSLITRKPYRGINRILLGVMAHVQGYSSHYWLTYRQANELGGHVRKGEKGCPCFFWKVYDGKKTREDEAPANDAGNKEQKRFVARYYTVFSLDQCEGIEAPAPAETPLLAFEPLVACERIVAGYHGPTIDQGNYDPCYFPQRDLVHVPSPKLFYSRENYYVTLFHELGHSTGHPTRLGRFSTDIDAPFTSQEYSKEEMVAELTSAFLCAEAGITATSINDQAAYIAGWLRALRNDNRLIVMAATQAEKAADFILNRAPDETR